jgi:sulfate transport system ATP-binding protein
VLADLAAETPTRTREEAGDALGYCRPHELEIGRTERGHGLWATVGGARVAGALARVELHDSEGGLIQVELAREAYARLGATTGERVYVTPRHLRVFPTGPEPAAVRSRAREA